MNALEMDKGVDKVDDEVNLEMVEEADEKVDEKLCIEGDDLWDISPSPASDSTVNTAFTARTSGEPSWS